MRPVKAQVRCERAKRLIGVLAVPCLLVGLGGFLVFYPRESEAVPVVRRNAWPPDPGPSGPYFIQSEFEKIRSKRVFYRVIDRYALTNRWRPEGGIPLRKSDVYHLLLQRSQVSLVRGGTSLISEDWMTNPVAIKIRGSDPGECAELANAIAEGYRDVAAERLKEILAEGQRAVEILRRASPVPVPSWPKPVGAILILGGCLAAVRRLL